MKINLDNLAEEIDALPEMGQVYLNKKTGEIVYMQDEYFSMAEEDEPVDDLNDWERDSVRDAKNIHETNDYISLPDKHSIDEWDMMRRFCNTVEDERKREKLLYLIQGKGAFRLFKEAIIDFGIRDEWHLFKHESIKEFAKDWCDENGLDYYEEDRPWLSDLKKKIKQKKEQKESPADFNRDKIDEAVLALLYYNAFKDDFSLRSWKGMPRDVMNRLHEKGYISNPKSKVKSVSFSEEGEEAARDVFKKYFGRKNT